MRQDVVVAGVMAGVLCLGLGLLRYTMSPSVEPAEVPARSTEPAPRTASSPASVSTKPSAAGRTDPVRTRGVPPPEVPPGDERDAARVPVAPGESDAARPRKIAPPLPPGVADAILGEVGETLDQKKVVNVVPDGPLVNLYQDDGYDSVSRAKIDLDQDGQWDEKWDIKDGVVRRRVSPDDDGTYTEAYVWKDGGWKGARKPRSRNQ